MRFLSLKNKKILLGHGLKVFLRTTQDAEPPSLLASPARRPRHRCQEGTWRRPPNHAVKLGRHFV